MRVCYTYRIRKVETMTNYKPISLFGTPHVEFCFPGTKEDNIKAMKEIFEKNLKEKYFYKPEESGNNYIRIHQKIGFSNDTVNVMVIAAIDKIYIVSTDTASTFELDDYCNFTGIHRQSYNSTQAGKMTRNLPHLSKVCSHILDYYEIQGYNSNCGL
jgi:hypothetical protein